MTACDHLASLRADADAALADLASLRCGDPAAAAAVRTVELARLTIERCWIPALLGATPAARSDIPPSKHDDV